MKNNFKILGIGEIVVDKTYFLDEFPTEGLKFQSTDSIEGVGGPVPTALKFLQNMGCEVELIGTVGDDYGANFLKKELENFSIKTSFIKNNSTKINTILVNNKTGERTIIKDLDRNNKIEKIDIEKIKEADAILFDRTEKKLFDFVIKYKRKDTIIIVDTSTEYNEKIIDFLKNSSEVIIPVEVINKIGKQNNNLSVLRTALFNTKESKNIIITDGKNGTHIFNGKDKKTISALNIKSIDSNGAGDVFRGAYTWGLLQSWDTEKIINFANKVAGLQCTKKGNLGAVPRKEDLI